MPERSIKMNLSRKTFLYSVVIAVIITALIVGYFILMVPSLYVSHIQDRNYASVVALQKGYMKFGSYDQLEVKNPSGTLTLRIPRAGSRIFITNKVFQITVDIEDQKIIRLLEKLRYYADHPKELDHLDRDELQLSEVLKDLTLDETQLKKYPLKFKFELFQDKNMFRPLSDKLHVESEKLVVFEANVTDGNNYYTSYIALGVTEEAIDITFVPMMTPRMDEISPVIISSLPMIIAVTLLLSLIASQLFSRQIIQPIIRLASHAQYRSTQKDLKLEPLEITGQDEISSLGRSLNELYLRIQESYEELEITNRYLAEENERQEVFLRASSHQLKTPVTAALLLVQGMISEVGKYKDVKEYLPKVKEQLLSMQRMVEDILDLNRSVRSMEPEEVSLPELCEECLANYRFQIEEKEITVTVKQYPLQLITDRELMKRILDNLISNAVYYTPQGGELQIAYEDTGLSIINYGATIEEELLPHVFEPFVTCAGQRRGHGLGLYVVAYYAKILGLRVKISNINNGVMATLSFTKDKAEHLL